MTAQKTVGRNRKVRGQREKGYAKCRKKGRTVEKGKKREKRMKK